MSIERDGDLSPGLRDVDIGALPDLFDTVLDRSGTGVVVFDEELRIAYLNDVAARVGGDPADVHLGRRLSELHPQMAVQAEPALVEALERQEPVAAQELVWESSRPPHERRFWHVTYVPLRAPGGERYVAAIYVETSESRRAHERLARLLDALPTFVCMCTPDGIITEANAATLAAADLRREDLVGRPLWEAAWWRHDRAVRRRIHDAVVLAQEGRATQLDVEVQVEPGRRVALDFRLAPIIEHGAVTALVPSALEISDRVAETDRLRALATLSRQLNGAVTTSQACRHIVTHAAAVVGATFANVALLDPERHALRVVQDTDPEVVRRWSVLSLHGPRTPFHDALSTGRTVIVDRPMRAQRYPDMVADTERVGLDTTAAVPLTDESGAVFGAVGIGWPTSLDDLHQARLRLQLLGDLCSEALRRARRTDAEHRFVGELQLEVLAAPDVSHDLDVAVSYEPAQSEIGMGGDWYDVIVLGEGCTAFVVGDVVGHGLAAAARMTEAKATIRSMVLTADHEEVIPATGRSLAHLDSGYVATAAVAWVDTSAGELRWCSAGHLPPVLRTPDGATRVLDGPHHPPIGMPTQPTALSAAGFPIGSLLVMCTDGLIERRGDQIDVGIERLRELVASLPEGCSADEAVDVLLREMHAAESDDDVAIVVVRSR